MDYVIARVVGNELPPRDSQMSKYESLLYVLQNEQTDGFERVWVLNRIHDPQYRQLITDTLAGEEVLEIPFEIKEYLQCATFDERVLYATNLNAARNFALDHCRRNFRFTALLDQDCYYQTDEWLKARQIIEIDQKSHGRKYYCSPTKRWHGAMSATMPEEEPMVIFRNDADQFFNPSLPYGRRSKLDLLKRLGIKKVAGEWIFNSDEAIRAGTVRHISFSDFHSEIDAERRHLMRQESIKTLIHKLDLLGLKFL